MTIEDILDETGGFGKFQLLIVLCITLNSFTIGWSMLQMAFSGYIPDWYCLSSNASQSDNKSFQTCSITTNDGIATEDASCTSYQFEQSSVTIITQWNLVCGLSWVKATVTSIQMAGVLVGVVLAGRLSDCIGRKKTMYIFVLEHAALNFIAAFSVNWHMFAACRFFIGLGIGVVIVTSFPYSLEFLPLKWRPLVSALPIWSLGIAVFALAGWLMENWSHLHIACGALSLPGLLGYFYVPESLRWLTAHDQIQEAQEVVSKIAVVNQKLQLRKASIMVQTVAWEEQKFRETNKQNMYLDIFKEKQIAKTTLMFSYHGFSLSVVYYGISFSVWTLAGNIYLNIFLLAVVEIPSILLTFFSDNKIRRKWSSCICLAIACLAAFGCILAQYYGPDHSKGSIITGLFLTTKLAAGAAWGVIQAWGAELYPSQTRNHGLLTANIAARVGAVVAPFLVNLENIAIASFSVLGCLLFVDIVLCLVTSETKGHKPTLPSIRIQGPRDAPVHTIDLNHEHGSGSESSTDVLENRLSSISLELPEDVLGTIDEETSSIETDEKEADSFKYINGHTENGKAATVTFAEDTIDKTVNSNNLEDSPPGIKKEKMSKKDKNTELKLEKVSKKSSPVPKPKKNKLDKLKKNVDLIQGKSKSKSKPQEEFPPHIESEYHKNIRYSIY